MQTRCTWNPVPASVLEEEDEVEGYSIRYWVEGQEHETMEEQDFSAEDTEAFITHQPADEGNMAFEVRT